MDEPERILRSAVHLLLDMGSQARERRLEIVRVPGQLVEDRLAPSHSHLAAARRVQPGAPLDVVCEQPSYHLELGVGAVEERLGH